MKSMENLVEGYFLVTNDGLIFEVKGNVHPSNRVIAYLRYVVDSAGDRQSQDRITYRKIYPLENRESYLREKHPQFLQFDKRYNRVLQVVHKNHIAYVFNPIDYLNRFRDMGIHRTALQNSTLELSEKLVIVSGISWNSIGITGSQLVGLSTDSSDIDLVVYGKHAGIRLHDSLKKNYDKIKGLKRYDGKILQRHVEFRWGKDNPYIKLLNIIEQKKVLQGTFNDIDFFIRLVKLPDEIPFQYSDRTYHSLGTRVLNCLILDDSQSIFTPCEYLVSCEQVPELKYITSYRGRFTEHVCNGKNVEVRGRMEKVVSKDGSYWLQIVLGEMKTDYLIPLES